MHTGWGAREGKTEWLMGRPQLIFGVVNNEILRQVLNGVHDLEKIGCP